MGGIIPRPHCLRVTLGALCVPVLRERGEEVPALVPEAHASKQDPQLTSSHLSERWTGCEASSFLSSLRNACGAGPRARMRRRLTAQAEGKRVLQGRLQLIPHSLEQNVPLPTRSLGKYPGQLGVPSVKLSLTPPSPTPPKQSLPS